jgi:RNAse (barnase) inhibitor barstar
MLHSIFKNKKNTQAYYVRCAISDLKKKIRDITQFHNIFVGEFNCVKWRTREDIFNDFTKNLNFPEYFGRNWDAFDECINDLEWLEEEYILLVFYNFFKTLPENEEIFDILLDILPKPTTDQNMDNVSLEDEPKTIRLIFHSTKKNYNKTRHNKLRTFFDIEDLYIKREHNNVNRR